MAFLNERGIVHRDIKPSNGTRQSSYLISDAYVFLTAYFMLLCAKTLGHRPVMCKTTPPTKGNTIPHRIEAIRCLLGDVSRLELYAMLDVIIDFVNVYVNFGDFSSVSLCHQIVLECMGSIFWQKPLCKRPFVQRTDRRICTVSLIGSMIYDCMVYNS